MSISKRRRHWLSLLLISAGLLFVDTALVISGVAQSLDSRLWVDYANALGQQGFKVVEAITLVGITVPSGRYLTILIAVATALTVASLAARRLPFVGATLVALVTGSAALAQVLKVIVRRSGPPLSPFTPLGHTFPSGTAAVAVAFLAYIAYVAVHRLRGMSKLVSLSILSALAIAMAASALTYHYPTEVIGGILLGFGWLCALQLLFWEPLRRELFARAIPSHDLAEADSTTTN